MVKSKNKYIVIDKSFSNWLRLLTGPRLAVLIALALHSDGRGYSKVGLNQLADETGYIEGTIIRTLKELYRLEADGVVAVTLLGPEMRGRGNINCYALFRPAVDTPAGARSKQ